MIIGTEEVKGGTSWIRYCMELDTSISYIKERISTSLYCREILSLVPSLLVI